MFSNEKACASRIELYQLIPEWKMSGFVGFVILKFWFNSLHCIIIYISAQDYLS